MSRSEHRKQGSLNRARILAAFGQTGATVDTVAEKLGLHRDAVNEEAPWHAAELTTENAAVYDVELTGDDCEWDFRDQAESFTDDGEPRGGFYDGQGRPRTGARGDDGKLLDGHAEKVVRPAYVRVTLLARSQDEAEAAAFATHPGHHTVKSCTRRDG